MWFFSVIQISVLQASSEYWTRIQTHIKCSDPCAKQWLLVITNHLRYLHHLLAVGVVAHNEKRCTLPSGRYFYLNSRHHLLTVMPTWREMKKPGAYSFWNGNFKFEIQQTMFVTRVGIRGGHWEWPIYVRPTWNTLSKNHVEIWVQKSALLDKYLPNHVSTPKYAESRIATCWKLQQATLTLWKTQNTKYVIHLVFILRRKESNITSGCHQLLVPNNLEYGFSYIFVTVIFVD